jgi:shikimate kinase
MTLNRKILLIGMMGSGKSVTGRSLAGMIQATFIDLDRSVETRAGLSIAEIFEKHGEAQFREMESRELQALADLPGLLVAATGGGVVLRPKNVRWMKDHGTVVYLEASPEVLWQRVKGNRRRPLLASENPKAVLEKICAERQNLYEEAAVLRVQTDGRTAEDVAQEIREKLEL